MARRDIRGCDELDWLAFQYAAGELSIQDRVEFERRLGRDLDACEALARMVELCGSIALVESSAPPPRTPRPSRRIGWLGRACVSAAAATLLALASSVSTPSSPRFVTPASEDVMDDSEDLALAWSDLRRDHEEHVSGAWFGAERLTERVWSPIRSSWDEDDPPIPSWLLATLDDEDETNEDADKGN